MLGLGQTGHQDDYCAQHPSMSTSYLRCMSAKNVQTSLPTEKKMRKIRWRLCTSPIPSYASRGRRGLATLCVSTNSPFSQVRHIRTCFQHWRGGLATLCVSTNFPYRGAEDLSIFHNHGSALALRSNKEPERVEWFLFKGAICDSFLAQIRCLDVVVVSRLCY